MKQNPFSVYDFIGYITPGIFLVCSAFIISECKIVASISFVGLMESIPSLKLEGLVFMLLIAYCLGHLLSFISSITVERYSVWKYGYPSRYLLEMPIHNFCDHFKTFYGIFWGIIMMLLLLPTVLLDYILGNLFGLKYFYGRPIDKELAKVIVFKINILAENMGLTEENGFENGGGMKSDFFRIVQHHTYDYSNNHQSKFTNYVALYGFLRTMTLLFNVLFWYLIVHFIIIERFTIMSSILVVLTSLVSYTFYMAYMKFYRRYTLEGFMVLVIDKGLYVSPKVGANNSI